MKKAYLVRNSKYGDSAIVVFAENATKAKSFAHNTVDDFDEYVSIRATRYPRADFIAKRTGEEADAMWFNESEYAGYLREWGWFEHDGGSCSECGLSEFTALPESQLNKEGICVQCEEKNKIRKIGG